MLPIQSWIFATVGNVIKYNDSYPFFCILSCLWPWRTNFEPPPQIDLPVVFLLLWWTAGFSVTRVVMTLVGPIFVMPPIWHWGPTHGHCYRISPHFCTHKASLISNKFLNTYPFSKIGFCFITRQRKISFRYESTNGKSSNSISLNPLHSKPQTFLTPVEVNIIKASTFKYIPHKRTSHIK